MPLRIGQACRLPLRRPQSCLQALIGGSCRRFATNGKEPKDIAILGGGITGLAAAFALLRLGTDQDQLRITIFDSKKTLGGWIQSEFVDVPGGKVLLERAVRTLRPAGPSGLVGLLTIHELGLEEEAITCSKSSAAAKNRYVFYPDHLVRMPSSLSDIPRFLKEPLAEGLVGGILKEALSAPDYGRRGGGQFDYSDMPQLPGITAASHATIDSTVGEALSERFHPRVADLASAVLHGIYAGDVDTLSFASLFPQLRHYLQHDQSIVRGALGNLWRSMTKDETLMSIDDRAWYNNVAERWAANANERSGMERLGPRLAALQKIQSSSVFSFKNGVQQLSDRMIEVLRQSPQVTFKTECPISSVRVDTRGTSQVTIKTSEHEENEHHFTHAISTLPSKGLNALLGLDVDPLKLSNVDHELSLALTGNPSVSVMVVNLWYPDPDLLPVKGFGYLIPRHVPSEQNPELGLGVVFDSDAIQGQDTVPGTKLTVMLGGHYWKEFDKRFLPSESEGISNAKSLVARHLGVTNEPMIAKATMQWDCIPQYRRNHLVNMATLSSQLSSERFDSRLVLAGSSYDGVGVNDCIRSGRSAAEAIMGTDRPHAGLAKSVSSALDFVSAPKSLRAFKFE